MHDLKTLYRQAMCDYLESRNPQELIACLGDFTQVAYDHQLEMRAALATMVAVRLRCHDAFDPVEWRTLSDFFAALFALGIGKDTSMSNEHPYRKYLTPMAKELLDALTKAEGWLSRRELATAVHRPNLNYASICLLDQTAREGWIEIRRSSGDTGGRRPQSSTE